MPDFAYWLNRSGRIPLTEAMDRVLHTGNPDAPFAAVALHESLDYDAIPIELIVTSDVTDWDLLGLYLEPLYRDMRADYYRERRRFRSISNRMQSQFDKRECENCGRRFLPRTRSYRAGGQPFDAYCSRACGERGRRDRIADKKLKRYTYDGERLTTLDLADRAGVTPKTFRARLYRGWSLHEAVTGERR